MKTTNKFEALRFLGNFIAAVGWVVMGGGVVFSLYSFIQSANSILLSNAGIFTGLWGIVCGFFILVYGQVIICFVSIEHNTRRTADLLEEKYQD